VITKDLDVDAYLWLIKRILNFAVWQVPVMYILWPKTAKRSESKSTVSQLAISRDPSAFGYGYSLSPGPSNLNDSSSESGLDTYADVTNFKQSMI
jgi:hypothetical protein